MIPICSPIKGKPLDPRMSKGYRLLQPYTLSDGEVIPSLFDWDGATIPRICWSIVGSPFHPDVLAPSLEHDYNYWTRRLDRAEADDTFYRSLREWGYSFARATAMHRAVRTFGHLFYKRTPIDIQYAVTLANHRLSLGLQSPFLTHFPEA
jgi:hypothetical protein